MPLIIAVTADIIKSEALRKQHRDVLKGYFENNIAPNLKKVIEEKKSQPKALLSFEVVRGDSFQFAFYKHPKEFWNFLLYLFVKIRKELNPAGFRCGIGIAYEEIPTLPLAESTAYALTYSGKALDSIKKGAYSTFISDENLEQNEITAVVNMLFVMLSKYSPKQLELAKLSLELQFKNEESTLTALAQKLGISLPTVSKQMKAMNWTEIQALLRYLSIQTPLLPIVKNE